MEVEDPLFVEDSSTPGGFFFHFHVMCLSECKGEGFGGRTWSLHGRCGRRCLQLLEALSACSEIGVLLGPFWGHPQQRRSEGTLGGGFPLPEKY